VHDTLTVGIPVLAILFGILFNQRAVDKLEARMDARFNAVDARFNGIEGRFNGIEGQFNGVDARLDRMQADLSQFYRTLGQHDADIATLKANKR